MGWDMLNCRLTGQWFHCVPLSQRFFSIFKVAVVEDAVSLGAVFDGAKGGFPPPFLHDATMVNFCSFIGRVTTTDELIAEWGSYPQGELSAAAGGQRARV